MGTAKRKSPPLPPHMTVQEFRDWAGDGTGRKFELVDGVLRAMAPPAGTHSIIQSNLIRLIDTHLLAKRLPCVTGTTPGVIPKVNADENMRIPDLGVFCSKTPDARRELENPVLLVEILSPGNKARTWTNIWSYTTIASVKELLVVSSVKKDVKLIRRLDDGSWPDEPTALGGVAEFQLTSIDMTLAVQDMYARTKLA
jgi:Uma2 family endonuclease